MSKRLLFALAGLAAVGAHAVEPRPVGDPEAGAAKSATCAACHGLDGNSPAPEWPKLAGQHEDYAYRQTVMVRDGGRDVPVMLPFVTGLSDQDIADISAYFATRIIMPGVADDSPIPDREQSFAELGQDLYRGGKSDAGVPACLACHGAAGRGIPATGYPSLAGQHATYTAAQLRFFQQGNHYGDEGDPSTIMVSIAQRLDDTEINALATYIEGLHRFDPNAAPVEAAPAEAAPVVPVPAGSAQDGVDGAAPVEADAGVDEPVPDEDSPESPDSGT